MSDSAMKTTLQAMLAPTYDEDRTRAHENPRRIRHSKAPAATSRTGAVRRLVGWSFGRLRRAALVPAVTTSEPIAASA